jgi:hypothetical protein
MWISRHHLGSKQSKIFKGAYLYFFDKLGTRDAGPLLSHVLLLLDSLGQLVSENLGGRLLGLFFLFLGVHVIHHLLRVTGGTRRIR